MSYAQEQRGVACVDGHIAYHCTVLHVDSLCGSPSYESSSILACLYRSGRDAVAHCQPVAGLAYESCTVAVVRVGLSDCHLRDDVLHEHGLVGDAGQGSGIAFAPNLALEHEVADGSAIDRAQERMSAGFCTYVHSDGMSLSVQCTAVAIGQPFVLLHVAEQAHIYIRCARIVLLYEIVPALLALDEHISVGLFGATAVGAQAIHKVVAVLCGRSTLVVVAYALVVSAVAMLSARAEHLLVGAVKRGSSVAVQCLVEADRALVSVQTIAESA